MRTNIVIKDDLMQKAQDLTGHKTKKATIEEALKLLIEIKQQSNIRSMRGTLRWEGDLEAMRTDS
ncbi:MAG TPA: type II toxin-antitoxin system VapB family antitoxin [Treponema sp.]|nr:type II toxin-antitoxin system VapB family antitoxin [Treponema sp.]HPC72339.1 type II toxin-antitoxin system VapB family antitoxin [Treponema sp.]HRS03678.1 type II toxin-antitoxin system VapB family antitoxin [Treponema sp.]HRU29490.1 type II toxin-antitoxin system VapB family antitoxin [Treponema sp.]